MKKLKGIILAVIISLASIMMPFSVYAETIDTHVRGRNYIYEPITYNEIQVSTNTYYENIGVFHITFELDDEYIGYVLPNYTLQYDTYFYGASNPNWGTLSKTFDRRIFVNGSSFSFDVTVNWNSISINNAPGGDPFNYDSYNITSSDVTKYADIDSLDQIINILQDNLNFITDIYGELQTVVTNTSLANTYLETLTKFRQYNFPIESFTFVNQFMQKGYEIHDFYTNNQYIYPIFTLPAEQYIESQWTNTTDQYQQTLLIGVEGNIYNKQTFETYFDSYNLGSYSVSSIYRKDDPWRLPFSIIKVIYNSADSSINRVRFIAKSDLKIIPIYHEYSYNKNISTDFALVYGLSNSLLDNLNIIAVGTTQSASAASNLDSGNNQMADDMNDLATIENGYNQQFNNQLQSIDFTSPIQSNAGILPAANFVISIFNGLINNNPFSVLIIIVCILLIGKKVIGK